MNEKNLFEKPLTISVVGKGGSGKTIITTLLAKSISKRYKYKILLIDADPTHPHLSQMVKLIPEKSLEKLRTDVIDGILTKGRDFEELAKNIDFEVYNAITENKSFSLPIVYHNEVRDTCCNVHSFSVYKRYIDAYTKVQSDIT